MGILELLILPREVKMHLEEEDEDEEEEEETRSENR
jgi:hypothetical protein